MVIDRKKTVLVLHLAGQIPLAGVAWQALHYVLGLRRLGFDVWYIEDSGAPPIDPGTGLPAADCNYSVGFVRTMMERYDLGDRWAYWDAARNEVHGTTRENLTKLYRNAAAILNLSGATHLREEHMQCPIRVYIDTDPGAALAKLAEGDRDAIEFLGAHTHHFSYGENLGSDDCLVPDGGFSWGRTRAPVLVDLWDAGCVPAGPYFTSVATWENRRADIRLGDTTYRGSKHVNFLRFIELPRQLLQPFRLAMLPPGPEVAERVRACGWDIVDPVPLSADMRAYRDFILTSRGEFTVAKDIYVGSKSGWFGDRSACYLAAGRPVITQETGFSRFIETGRGLFGFSTVDEVRDAVAQINGDYARHSIGAIEIAYEYFDADTVLRKLTDDIGV